MKSNRYWVHYIAARDAAVAGDVAKFDAAIVHLPDSYLERLRYWCVRHGVAWP